MRLCVTLKMPSHLHTEGLWRMLFVYHKQSNVKGTDLSFTIPSTRLEKSTKFIGHLNCYINSISRLSLDNQQGVGKVLSARNACTGAQIGLAPLILQFISKCFL